MKKLAKKNKVFVVIISLVLIIIGVAGFVLLPRIGKAPDDYVWNGEESFSMDYIETLTMKEGEDFRILQLTDTQFDVPFKSKKTLKIILDKLISENKPNLIIITGDVVAGVLTHFHIHDIIKIMDSYEIPWAPVFGNHDREQTANLYYQSKQYYKSKYCMFKEGPNNIQGLGNYVINIVKGDDVVRSLFLIDSNKDRYYEIDGEQKKMYDYIYPNQIEWYADNVNAISKKIGRVVPSMAFFHIPLPEYQEAFDHYYSNSGEVEWEGGEKREDVCCPPVNSGLFDRMLGLKSTTHIFVGHDHVNNFTAKYKGITLTYGTKTGNFSYYDKDLNGGTLITINNQNDVKVERKLVAI